MKLAVFVFLMILAQEASCQGQIMLASSEPDPQYCSDLWHKGVGYNSSFQYQKEYDTLKAYVEQCPLDKNSFRAFGSTTNASNGLYNNGDTIWAQYRDWLKKFLYNNPDSLYYCSDLLAYAGSFEFKDELGNAPNLKTTLSIMRFLADSSHCSSIKDEISGDWNYYHLIWKDTVKDSLKTPFDTVLPTIDQINHSWLRGFKAGVDNGISSVAKDALGNLVAENNPFTDEVKLRYSLLKSVVAKVEIYDALGRKLWSDGQGYQETGEHLLKINTSRWSAGTYYARLMTLQGEVKTVKMEKE